MVITGTVTTPVACCAASRDVLQHLFHVPEPDRQRHDAAGLVPAQRLGLVEADPGYRYQRRLVTGEPGVHELVGGAGFSRQIDAREARGARSRAVTHHVLHHVVHDERVARVEDAQRLVARALRVGERERIAAVIDDLVDEYGWMRYPPFANTAYARASCHAVTDPAPSAIVRYGGCRSGSKPKRVT